MHTVAFHGDFARPSDLADDAGHPFWIDAYPAYDRDVSQLDNLVRDLRQHRDLVLVGYSRGGDLVAYLSTVLANIVAAVVYESPVQTVRRTGGRFPVLQIWNLQSNRRHTRAASAAYAAWLGPPPHRQVDILFGTGRHTRPVFRPRTLFRGHGWDRQLNPRIHEWLQANAIPVSGTALAAGSSADPVCADPPVASAIPLTGSATLPLGESERCRSGEGSSPSCPYDIIYSTLHLDTNQTHQDPT